ncbi:MAG: TetR/AcrR family transcriptional regulator [Actinoallomurus sp.]
MTDGNGGTGLPASIELAWGLRTRPTKGPKPGLSLDRIVTAGVRVASAEGLAAVSMGRIAKELGATAMSLYRHVAAKDELLALMVDAAFGPPPTIGAHDWRAALTEWAWAHLGALRAHPWVLHVQLSGYPATPNQIGWLERGLAAMRDTGLAEHEKLSVIMLLIALARAQAGLSDPLNARLADSGMTETEAGRVYTQLLRTVTNGETYPAITAFLDSGALDRPDAPDAEFVFGLERVLDGVAALTHVRRKR